MTSRKCDEILSTLCCWKDSYLRQRRERDNHNFVTSHRITEHNRNGIIYVIHHSGAQSSKCVYASSTLSRPGDHNSRLRIKRKKKVVTLTVRRSHINKKSVSSLASQFVLSLHARLYLNSSLDSLSLHIYTFFAFDWCSEYSLVPSSLVSLAIELKSWLRQSYFFSLLSTHVPLRHFNLFGKNSLHLTALF